MEKHRTRVMFRRVSLWARSGEQLLKQPQNLSSRKKLLFKISDTQPFLPVCVLANDF